MSGGRAILGLGSGDMPQEFRQLGLAWRPAAERQAALEEALQIIRPLLRGQRVTFTGRHVHVADAVLEPPPLQAAGVPIVVAGGGERTTLRFAAHYADGVNLGAASRAGGAFGPEDVHRKFAVLHRHCQAAERTPSSVLKTALAALVLGPSAGAVSAKLEQVPPPLLSIFERLPMLRGDTSKGENHEHSASPLPTLRDPTHGTFRRVGRLLLQLPAAVGHAACGAPGDGRRTIHTPAGAAPVRSG